MHFRYMDDRFGFVEVESDTAWIMDDFGELVEVNWNMPTWYWQEA